MLQRDILKTSEPTSTHIGDIGIRVVQDKGMKWSTLGSGGQRSRSLEAKDRFGVLQPLAVGSSTLSNDR